MTIRTSVSALTGASLLLASAAFAQKAPRYVSPIAQQQQQAAPLTPPATKAITPDAEVVQDMVVRINDQIITRSDYARSQQQLEQEIAQNHLSPAEADQRRKDMLRDLIDQQLLLSKGKELGINADADTVRRLDEIRKQNHFETMEDFEDAARKEGVSFEDFKASIRNNIITGQVVRDEVARKLQMTHADEVHYYNQHKQEFEQPEQVHLAEILVQTSASPTDAELATAQKKADDIAAQLASGAKFDEVAKANSGGPTAQQGGDLGMFKRGALAQVLEDKTFGLKAGENTAPIRTRQGFVILKVIEHVPAGVPPLDQIEQQVQEAMYGDQMNPALRAYLTKLREDSYVDLRPGYVDTGASPRQTSFTFTAYTPPAPKKKAEKARFDTAKTGRLATDAPKDGATLATLELDKNGKPKKIKREKVRYGQAPRTALPAAPANQRAAVGGQEAAPGQAIAPVDDNPLTMAQNDAAAANAVNPLEQQAPAPDHKVRFSSKQAEFAKAQNDRKTTFAREKAAAMPDGPSEEEIEATQIQSAPAGLKGDTTKKVKRKKGEEKKRIQNTTQAPSATQQEINSQKNGDGTYKNPVPPGTGDTTNK